MKKRKLFILPLIGLAAISMTSCGEPNNTDSSGSTPVEVNPDSLSSILLNSNNVKTTYYEGQPLDLTGLIVTAKYGNGTTKEVTNYTYDETTFNPNKRGDQYVKIIYEEGGITKTKSLHVVVKTILESVNNVIGVTATTQKTSYVFGEELDLSDLVVTAYYEDGTTKVLNSNQYKVNADSFNSKMRGDYEIGVTFTEDYTVDGITRSCEVETCFFASVVLNMESIKIAKGTSTFLQYSDLDISNWEVEITYKEGVKETIKEGFTTDIKEKLGDTSVARTETVTATFTYNGVTKTATRTVEVIPARKTFNAGVLDYCDTPSQEDKVLDKFTVKKGYILTADSQTCGCQTFARSLLLLGAGTRDEYSVELNIGIENTITVVAASQEGSEIGLYDSEGNVVKTYKVGTSLTRFTFNVEDAGKYYVWSTGGVSLYFIGAYNM